MEKSMFKYSDFYGFFTKYSLLDNYGFFNGFKSRIIYKILPEYIDSASFEKHILSCKTDGLSPTDISNSIDFEKLNYALLKEDLNHSITLLSSKVIAVGLDKNIKYKLQGLNLDINVFTKLSQYCADIDDTNKTDIYKLIDEIKVLFQNFRKQKDSFGTSIQLTYKTRLLEKYLQRLRLLTQLYYDTRNRQTWTELINDYITEYSNHRSLTNYFKYHFDLVLLQIVNHTSKKGEKYIAKTQKEYLSFLKKSMLGGAVICIFALIKIYIDGFYNSILQDAFLFSINYALCFIVVKMLGGLIATKQPAKTASTISKFVDKNDNLKVDNTKDVVNIIRNTSSSQFISFIGNVSVALPLAIVLFLAINMFTGISLVDSYKIKVLKSELSVLNFINLYYAAIAGVFLSLSGFISGIVDNKMVFSKAGNRLRASKFMNLFFVVDNADRISNAIENNTGAFVGNVCLGFFLGSAFLVSELLSIPFDIRHIAFSASYVGVLIGSEGISLQEFYLCFLGIWMIGFINFFVSFLITLTITLKSRGITTQQLKDSSKGLLTALLKNPISFIYFKKATA